MGSKVHIKKNPYENMAAGADKELFKKNNPYAMTLTQMRHQYHKQLEEGRTLQDVISWYNYMHNVGKSDKTGTPYDYIINDTGEDIPGLRTYESLGMENRPIEDQFGGVHDLDQIKKTLSSLFPDNTLYSTNDNNAMSTTTPHQYTDSQKTVQDLYGRLLGRQAANEGMSYWTDQLDNQGKTIEDLTRAIRSGSEYKNRASTVDAYKTANAGANPTEAYLDARVSPGGGTLDPNNPDTAPTFGANNTWSSPLMTKGNNTYTDELDAIVNQLGGYNTAPNVNLGAVTDATHNPDGTPITAATPAGVQSGMDEAAKSWYAQKYGAYDSQEAYDAANPATSTETGTGGMDEFMKFMMMLAIMPRGGGGQGGYGGGQYGYGGMSPGGVQAAHNPWEGMQQGWDFMSNNFGSGSGSGSGATSNLANVT